MKKSFVFSVLLVVFVGFSFSSCGGKENEKSKACEITSFTVNGEGWTVANGTITKLFSCKGTNVNNLTPTIVITGVKVEPASGIPQNFSSPVTYVVTAEDGSTKNYTVTVTVGSEICN